VRISARGWSRLVHPAVVIILTAVVIGIPLWLALVTSAKSQGEANLPDLSLPGVWHLWDNYSQAFTQGRMLWALFGSLLVMVPSVAGVLIFGSLASWVLARRSGRVMAVLYSAAISGIILPPAVVTIVLLLRQLNLASTPIGMMLVYMGMYMSLVIFFVTGFVRTIPVEVEEAARMDGARPLGIFIKVVLPLLRPVIVTVIVVQAVAVFNDFQNPLYFLPGSDLATVQLTLYNFQSQTLSQFNLLFMDILLITIPPLILYIFFNRQIVAGMTSGAING